jgi:hypothetical protein
MVNRDGPELFVFPADAGHRRRHRADGPAGGIKDPDRGCGRKLNGHFWSSASHMAEQLASRLLMFRRDRWPSTMTRSYGEPHRHCALTNGGTPPGNATSLAARQSIRILIVRQLKTPDAQEIPSSLHRYVQLATCFVALLAIRHTRASGNPLGAQRSLTRTPRFVGHGLEHGLLSKRFFPGRRPRGAAGGRAELLEILGIEQCRRDIESNHRV